MFSNGFLKFEKKILRFFVLNFYRIFFPFFSYPFFFFPVHVFVMVYDLLYFFSF